MRSSFLTLAYNRQEWIKNMLGNLPHPFCDVLAKVYGEYDIYHYKMLTKRGFQFFGKIKRQRMIPFVALCLPNCMSDCYSCHSLSICCSKMDITFAACARVEDSFGRN